MGVTGYESSPVPYSHDPSVPLVISGTDDHSISRGIDRYTCCHRDIYSGM